MHAGEKSDEGIVPMKQPNNEDLSSAEAVEGRTSPKGNGGQATVVRTQRRVATSNGLAAVRQAARQSKDVRFTALLHHITIDRLKQSYIALKRDAAPGIDGVTWRSYGKPGENYYLLFVKTTRSEFPYQESAFPNLNDSMFIQTRLLYRKWQ